MCNTGEVDKGPRKYTVLRRKRLLPWYSIRIATEGDTKYVTFCSTIHVTKESKVSPRFSAEFSDYDILDDNDLYAWVIRRYGADLFVKPY